MPDLPDPLERVSATRYLLPLREGGSLPGLVEASDLGTYVVKFRGAGQGPRALVAEVIAGELARAAGLPVPDLVVVDLDPRLAPAEPDEEVQDLLRASAGANLGMDFLPGALGFDASVDRIDADLAARVVWFDAYVQNPDRSWRNPNLLRWHGDPWLIDHGAALWFHHDWPRADAAPTRPYGQAAEHVLLAAADRPGSVHDAMAAAVDGALDAVLGLVPDEWLDDQSPDVRGDYARVLRERLAAAAAWLPAVDAAWTARREGAA